MIKRIMLAIVFLAAGTAMTGCGDFFERCNICVGRNENGYLDTYYHVDDPARKNQGAWVDDDDISHCSWVEGTACWQGADATVPSVYSPAAVGDGYEQEATECPDGDCEEE